MTNSSDDLGGLHGFMHAEVLPATIGRYQIHSQLGHGGMGKVYRAHDPQLEREVAIKVLLPDADMAANQKALLKEAQLAARLRHPHVVQIYEVVQDAPQPYIVMEYVKGFTLSQYVKQNRVSQEWTLAVMRKVALAIHHAHREGIIHRDIKPSNILLDEHNEPKVTDFGLAKMMNADTTISSYGMVIGTPSYIPPEQMRGDTYHIDQRSDVYGLGATLYELLTGKPPFMADTIVEIALAVLQQDAVKPSLLAAGVAPEVDAICLKCLEKNPRRRYQSASALAQDIERHLNDEPVASYSHSPFYHLRKKAWRGNGATIGSWLLAALLALSLIGNGWQYWQRQKTERVAGPRKLPAAADATKAPPAILHADDDASPDLSTATVDKSLRENGTCLLLLQDVIRTIYERKPYVDAEARWQVLHQLLGNDAEWLRLWGQCLFLYALRENDGDKRKSMLLRALDSERQVLVSLPGDCHAAYLVCQLCQKLYGEHWQGECGNECQLLSQRQDNGYSYCLAARNLCRPLWLSVDGESSSNRLAKAIAWCNEGLALNPELPDLYEIKTRLLFKAGNIKEAWQNCQLAWEKGYTQPSRQATLERSRWQGGWSEMGARMLPHPRYSELIALRGEIHSSSRNLAAALPFYSQAIEECPGNTDIYYKRGHCHNALHKYEQAIADFNKVLSGNSFIGESYLLRCDAYIGIKQHTAALRDADMLAQFYPKADTSHVAKARVYQDLGQYEDGLQEICKALQISPGNAKLYLLRANLYSLLQQPQQAMEDVKTAMKLQK